MEALISSKDHAALWALIAAGTAASIWMEQRLRWGGLMGRMNPGIYLLLLFLFTPGLLRLRIEELLIAVNASLGGAASAVALAVSAGWLRLVVPGILAGTGAM